MPVTIEEIIIDLAQSDKPLINARLAELVNLSAQELALLEKVWPTIELKRRRQIVSRLVELAEDNFELDFEVLFKDLLKDKDAEVKSKAIRGLYESEDVTLIEPLAALLERNSSDEVQTAAAVTLGKFAMMAALDKVRSCHVDELKRVLLTVFYDKTRTVEVRRCALESIAPLPIPEVSEVIREAYRNGNPRFKLSAIYAMGRNCQPIWLPILLNELGNSDAEIRYEAVVACGELEEEEAVPYLVELVNDSDTEVRLAAIQALGKIGGEEAKETLMNCLRSPSRAVQQMAEQALEELEAYEDPPSFRD